MTAPRSAPRRERHPGEGREAALGCAALILATLLVVACAALSVRLFLWLV